MTINIEELEAYGRIVDDNERSWTLCIIGDATSRMWAENPYNGEWFDTGQAQGTDEALNQINGMVWAWIESTNYGEVANAIA